MATYTGYSIVDYLKSIGQASDFASRKKLAEQLGIKDYRGAADQNLKMLDMLRSGQTATQKPAQTTVQPVAQTNTQAKSNYTGYSIVDYLKSIGQASDFASRKKLAEQLGIKDYRGAADQNLKMLDMLRSGQTATQKPAQTTVQPVAQTNTQAKSNLPEDYIKSIGTNRDWYDSMSGMSREEFESTLTPDMQMPRISTRGAGTNTTNQGAGTDTTKSPALTALDNISPQRQQVNELVQQLIDRLNTPYDPAADTGFQAAKGQLEGAADRAYRNVMASYLGNQSGDFNTAAMQIASGAQNQLLSQLPLLQAEYEDRYHSKIRQGLSDTMDIVNLLLGLEDRDIAASERDLQRQIETIAQYSNDYQAEINRRMAIDPNDPLIPYLKVADLQRQIETIAQYSNDYQAEINRRMAIDPNDPLIPYLKVARAQKIAAMKESELDAQEKAIKLAFDTWVKLGYATPEIAAILGIPVNAKTVEYADMLADNAREDKRLAASLKKAESESKKSKAESESKKSNDFGIALQTMLNSGDPMQWLVDNADVLTRDEIKELYKYAQDAGLRPDALFKSATPEQRAYYESFKDVYLNGISPLGGVSQYKDNPQAALDRLRSDVRSRELLGPLYAVLEEELIRAVEDKKKKSKAKSEFDEYLN